MFFDAHCHLQDGRFGDGLEGVLDRADRAGVTHMVCCGTREADWDAVLDLARRKATVIPCAGLHPWYADTPAAGWQARLEEQFDAGALPGECGLDFSDGRPPRDLQEAVLVDQLRMAVRRGLPVSLHCVKASERLQAILAETGLPAAGGLVHAFSGPPEVAQAFLDLGLHLSFGGALTRPGARRAAASLVMVREDRLLFETDAPDLAPEGVAGPGEPAHIRLVAEAASRLRGWDVSSLAYANAQRLFGRWAA